MKISDILSQNRKAFASFEIVPPLKGSDLRRLYGTVEPLMEFEPPFINITSHRDETVFRPRKDGSFERVTVNKRPGPVALAAAIMKRFHTEVVPHLICGGAARHKLENDLVDLNFLEIQNVMALRGDATPGEKYFTPHPEGHCYSSELVEQIVKMNQGEYLDEDISQAVPTNFCIGVAGYPEKHSEAPNMSTDIANLKKKVDAGADYIVTQMFFDNAHFEDFTKACRAAGITVPIIPGLKPVATRKHVEMLPRAFGIDLPEELMSELDGRPDADIRAIGAEWCANQSRQLLAMGVPAIHYYTMGKADNICSILRKVF